MLRTELIRPLPDLLAGHARHRGSKIAFRDRRSTVTYAELAHRTGRLAGHLAALGLQPADRVLIYLGNCVEVVETYLATARARGVGVPLNPHSADAELEHVVADSGARVVVTDPARLYQVRALLAGRDHLRVVVVGDGAEAGGAVVSYADLMAVAPPVPPRDDQELDDVAWMLYTSGTTGKPKGVLSTQRSCLWSVAACYAPILGLSEPDHVLWPLPLHHSLAHIFCVLGVTAVGATAQIMDGFDAEEVLRVLGEEPCTFLAGVPTLYHYLLEAAGKQGVRPARLRAAMTGGTVCPAGLRRSFEATFGLPLLDCYGSTETCGSFVVNWPTGTRVDGSCGLPVPGVSVRLVDPDSGADAGAGAEGEVWVRGPNLMVGYHNQPEATAEVLVDGWYRTGDLARADQAGYLTVTGRIKELIIRSGENVHPGEIEDVLRRVPGVADAAVVGRPHDIFGEVPIAFVVPGPDGVDPDLLFTTCRERLANFKVPEELYEIDQVPRTPSGKITRHVLFDLPARLRAASGEHDSLLHSESRVPAVLGGVMDAAPDRAGDPPALSGRLAGLTAPEQESLLLDLVRTEAASVAGLSAVARADAGTTFRELGLTSVSAVALRNRLAAATRLTLPTTLAFDHPTPTALARHLRAELLGERPATSDLAPAPVFAEEPVAIVGMACRYPGGITSPEDLWRLVTEGGEVLSPFPADRGWDLTALAGDGPGSSITGHGGFLAGAADFDAGFFGISPREAVAMDPQQRLVLETSWEAVERARIDPVSLRGSRTGVFAGVMYHDYGSGMAGPPPGAEAYWGIGTAGSVVSGRVSYALGLEGPAVTVDTACSSSLVAMHLARESLRRGECDLALAGGVAVMSTPQTFLEFTQQGGLSPDGRCRSFSDDADGTGWSEGVGVLLLERLSDALRNGHRVLATVAGSAVNADGASNGLTAPNRLAQERVIRQALTSAGLQPSDVDAVEAHGTGTTLGDPIEAYALLAAYGQGRDRPLWLGSVKSNLGHTQAAAGAAGVIKMVQALRHGLLPKTLHAGTPSSYVDWSAGAVELLTEPVEWPDGARPRRAGVSSFGISGTNAHVILEQAPPAPTPVEHVRVVPATVPLPVSAKTAAALDDQVARVRAAAAAHRPVDLGLSLVSSRSLFEHRAVLLSTTDGVTEVARGVAAQRSVAMVFSGQGAQRLGMGRELYDRFPVFAEALDEVLAQLDAEVRDVMWGADADALNRTGWAQPGLFAVEVALFHLVESFGVHPDFLLGHSIGEIVAAHVAGVLSLADACTLVSARARLMQALPGGGAMVAVEATEDEVTPLLSDGVSVAAVNGPRSVVLAGGAAAVAATAGDLAEQGRKTRRLPVSHAFHSPLMDAMLADFRTVVAGLSFAEPRVPVVSNLTGARATGDELRSPEYWVRQVRETVRFADGVRWLADAGVSAFLEIGPDGGLCAAAASSAPDAAVLPVLRRDGAEHPAFLAALAKLHVAGVPVEWDGCYAGTGARQVDLPTYAFQRRRFWPEPTVPITADAVDSTFWRLVDDGDLASMAAQLELDHDTTAAVLPALSTWRARQRNRSVVDSWRYRESWTGIPNRAPGTDLGPWLAVVPPGPADDWTTAVLSALGPDVVAIECDGDRATLAERFAKHASPALAGVVSLVAATNATGPARAVPAGLRSTVLTVQALGDAGIGAPVWCVTRGAVSVDPADPVTRPAQTALWGLGRAAAVELSQRWGGLIDLPEVVDERIMASVAAVLTGGEDQVAIRATGVFGRRLVRAPTTAAPARRWRARGTVLITGGTGGVGSQVARWAAGEGAEHLVLVSRQGKAAPGAAELAGELAELGARVTVASCDVADRDAMAALLADIPADLPLTAVVHAAGVGAGDAPVESMTEALLDPLLRAKVTAAWCLHELTRELDLDAFVLFSSGAGSWGSGGRPGYSAANAFLDGLAQYRRGLGLTATAIAWGSWEGAGMGADDREALDRFRRRGVLPMAPALALAALRQALDEDRTTLTVTNTDWSRFTPSFTAERPSPLLSELPEARAALSELDTELGPGAGADLRHRLEQLPAADRERVLLELVRAEAAAVLGYDRPDQISIDHVFRDQGFDSVTAVEMRERLRGATGLAVPPGLVFDYPTPRAVADYLLANLAPDATAPTGSVADELARLEAAVAMSTADVTDHAEVEQRLEKLLSRLRQPATPAVGRSSEEEIKSVPVDDLLNIIDAELFDRS